MTHYESGERLAARTTWPCERVLALDPEGLYRTVRDQHISMCGVLPTVVMLRAALALGRPAPNWSAMPIPGKSPATSAKWSVMPG